MQNPRNTKNKINTNEENIEKNSVKLLAWEKIIVKIDAIEAVINCINTPFINFEGSIHRLLLNRSVSVIEMILLGINPIINRIKKNQLPGDKAQMTGMLESRTAFIKEIIPKIIINIQINNIPVAVNFSLLSLGALTLPLELLIFPLNTIVISTYKLMPNVSNFSFTLLQ